MSRKPKTFDQTWREYQEYVKEHAIKEYKLPWKIANDLADILVNGKLAKHGNFIQALLQNQLVETSYFADECNWNNLFVICRWIQNEIPCTMWGKDAMKWQGLKNLEEE